MKKRTGRLIVALVLCAGIASAATVNGIWNGEASTDFNTAANWWLSPPAANQIAYFRGDTANTTANLSSATTISGVYYPGSGGANSDPTRAYTISGNTLTVDGVPESKANLIFINDLVTGDQTISADLVLKSHDNANNANIRTGSGGGGLILSGNVSVDAASPGGIGVWLGNGDVEISGNVASGVWKTLDLAGGSGTLKLTGTGEWTPGVTGLLQIGGGTEVLINRSTTDSSGFTATIQLLGGNLLLGNDEQMDDNKLLRFNVADSDAGTFKLDGHTETIRGLIFDGTTASASIDMGDGGVLHFTDQQYDFGVGWANLTILNWDEGSDHIYLDDGSMLGETQLATITFDEWEPAGAKVEGGELLPTGTNIALSAYENWAVNFGVGDGTNDFDADGLLNVYEYGLGGDPTNAADQGISPTYSISGETLIYIHPQLSDPNHGLDYHLELTDNLAIGSWSNAGYAITGTNMPAGDFNYVTNTVSTAIKSEQFIRLIIETL